MTPIVLNDENANPVTFVVRRQPSATLSAILQPVATGNGTKTELPRIEISMRVAGGRTEPVATVAVPFGETRNGTYHKLGQVTHVIRASQPDAAPNAVVERAATFAAQLTQNQAILDLFRDGELS